MKELENWCDFKFYILGLTKGFRGDSLVSDLKKYGFNYEIVEGIDGRSCPITLGTQEILVSKYFSNRLLTSTEIATTLGHWMMFRKARSDGTKFAVFLEDDAKILDIKKLFLALNEIRSEYERNNQNSIWLLIHRQFNFLGLRRKNESSMFSRTNLIPTLASAYVINQKGLQLIPQSSEISHSTGFLPDFPLHYADHLKFLTPSVSLIDVSGDESLIGDQRWLESRSSSSGFFKQALIFTCVSWFLTGYKYSSLKAHLMFFHGRKAVHLFLLFDDRLSRLAFRKKLKVLFHKRVNGI